MYDANSNDLNSLLVNQLLKEKRADRRWKIIRFICWFALFLFIAVSLSKSLGSKSIKNLGTIGGEKYTALVRLDGMINADGDFSAENVLPILRRAFADKNSSGVIIDIDSPGGTPVQASIIHDAILQYKKQFHKKVIVVGEDMLTSGAYFVAVAADKIYVNPNTITGSIGVIMKGFGFVDTIKKLGIERRVYTSGTSKDRLDPFLPLNPDDIAKIKEVEDEVHKNFVQAVTEGRKGKLKGDPNVLFNGDFWSGQSAKQLGLIDDLGNLLDAMTNEFQTTRYKEYGGSNTSSLMRMIGGQFTSAIDNIALRLT